MNTNRAIETSVAFSKDKPLPVNLELGPGERWFVARALTHQENRAQFNLHRLGFRNFLPRLRRTVRHSRRLRDTMNPLFPGYIFIIMDLSKHRWRSVNGTFGVASLIMGADQPAPVPPGVVEALVASCESRGVVRLERQSRDWREKWCAYCRDRSRRPFVVSRIWTTVGAFECYSKSWVRK